MQNAYCAEQLKQVTFPTCLMGNSHGMPGLETEIVFMKQGLQTKQWGNTKDTLLIMMRSLKVYNEFSV